MPSIIKKNENILILIGPEGDFSPEEINFALENGFKPITLGTQRLRTETAALVATIMVATENSK
jgi:16S rRNA (uracil1498-N3)-methyltransferase